MSVEPILHPSVLLGPVLQSPELLQPVLKLDPPVFLKMLVFLEELLQPVLKLEPPVFLKMLVFLKLVLLKLVLFPLVHGGQRHLLVKSKSSEKCSVDIDCLPAYTVQSVSFSVTCDVWHTVLFW